MTSQRLLSTAALILGLAGCGEDKPAKPPPVMDAGGGVSETDATVQYQGPTRGGAIRTGKDLPPAQGDDGPFEVSDECCDRTLTLPANGDELSVRAVGNQAPLDEDGVKLKKSGDEYTAVVCIPVGLAIQFRYAVELSSDAGSVTVFRADSSTTTIEDEVGQSWNLLVVNGCEPDAGS